MKAVNLTGGIITAADAMQALNVSRSGLCRIEKKGLLQGIPKRSYYLAQVQALMLDNTWRIGAKRGPKTKLKTI